MSSTADFVAMAFGDVACQRLLMKNVEYGSYSEISIHQEKALP